MGLRRGKNPKQIYSMRQTEGKSLKEGVWTQNKLSLPCLVSMDPLYSPSPSEDT